LATATAVLFLQRTNKSSPTSS